MRKNIVAGNWKMNLKVEDAKNLMKDLNAYLTDNDTNTEVVVAPTNIYLHSIIANTKNIKVAAQNCSENLKGAFTGEVSVNQLKSIGCNLVVLGHSERRQYNNESNELLKQKVDIALENEMQIIFCCGESLKERKAENHFATVETQLKESIFHLTAEQVKNVVIAYEPIWAIGTGETATPEQAQEMHAHIRKSLSKIYDEKLAEEISILYGGSVKPANAKLLFSQKDIDGGLVGGASLKSAGFIEIIKAFG